MNETASLDEKGKWVKANIFDSPVVYRICHEKKVTYFGGFIMEYIQGWCDRGIMAYKPEDTICYLSYEDIAYMFGVSKSMAIKAISQLLKHKLIERVNENERQGKNKSGYKLNVSLIKKAKTKYLAANPIDTEKG